MPGARILIGLVFCTFIMVLCAVSSSDAQWIQRGVECGIVNAFASTQSSLYAGIYGNGVFRSTDNGDHWTSIGLNLPTLEIESVAANDSTVIAGTNYDGVFKTTDNGVHWIDVASRLDSIAFIRSLFARGATILAGTGLGMYRSTDNGDTWSEANAGLPIYTNPYSFISMDSVIIAACDRGVYISTDDGLSWKANNNGLPSAIVYSVISVDSVLLASTHGFGVYASTDRGATWLPENSGLTDGYILSLTSGGGYVFAGSISGNLYRSSDFGTHWDESDSGLPGTNVRHLIASGNNILAGSYAKGIYKSSNKGIIWEATNQGVLGGLIRDLASEPNELLASGSNGVYRTTNSGLSWEDISLNLSPGAEAYSIATSGKNIIVATNYGSTGGVFLSNDHGATWVGGTSGLPNSIVNALSTVGDTVFCGTNGYGVLRSTDSGLHWGQASTGTIASTYIDAFSIDGDTILAASFNNSGGVWRSLDRGETWLQASTGLPTDPYQPGVYRDILSLAKNHSVLYAGTSYAGIYISTNNGDEWLESDSGLPANNNYNAQSFAIDSNTIYVGTTIGVFKSFDNGSHWEAFNTGFPSTLTVSSLLAANHMLFAGCYGGGVWTSPLDVTNVDNHSPLQLPFKFSLEQNYPNPFNPSTTISYSLVHAGTVSLTIFNVLGQEILHPVSGYEQPGMHSIKFAGDRFPGGAYYYRLNVNGMSLVRKMLLIK